MQSAHINFIGIGFLTLTINDNYYYYQYHKSSNGIYVLAFADNNDYYKQLGNYFLLKDNQVLCMGKLQRPNDGKVGNNGNFIINDWLRINSLSGKICAFNETGKELLNTKTKANLQINAISYSGKFALFSTANSDYEPHDNVIFLYELSEQAKLVWKRAGAKNWPQTYIINDNTSIEVKFRKRQPVTLNWNGYIEGTTDIGIDSLKWERDD